MKGVKFLDWFFCRENLSTLELVTRGNQLYKAGRREEALRDYNEALAKSPDDPAALIFRGGVYHSMQKYAEALADYTRAIELNPRNALAYYYRGNAYHMAGKPRKALADIERSLGLDPTNAGAEENKNFLIAYIAEHPEETE
jgi:tetratricopeptide (TPR) repeat protein